MKCAGELWRCGGGGGGGRDASPHLLSIHVRINGQSAAVGIVLTHGMLSNVILKLNVKNGSENRT